MVRAEVKPEVGSRKSTRPPATPSSPKQYPAFVGMCVAGGWQLVGTRVAAEPGIVELDWITEAKA